jgi:Tfp pilus assembly protein PilO
MDVLRRSRPAQIGVAAALVLVIAAGGWFLLVKPKKNDAKELAAQITAAEAALATRKEELSKPYAAVQVRAADLYRLTRALPDHVDVPGIVLQLDRLAKGNKVTLEAVSPSARIPATGHDEVPMTVRVQGRFANVSKFVGAVQRLTRVKNERLDSTGRLYVVKSVTLGAASSLGFPFVSGELGISAYAFTGSAPVVQPGTTTTEDESAPTASPSGSSEAAGANP